MTDNKIQVMNNKEPVGWGQTLRWQRVNGKPYRMTDLELEEADKKPSTYREFERAPASDPAIRTDWLKS